MNGLILIIEDNKFIQELIKEVLVDAGYKAKGVNTPGAALNLLEAIKFNLITLDLTMLGQESNKFIGEIGRLAPNTPIIVLTASPKLLLSNSPQIKALVIKPFDISDLLMVVEKHFSISVENNLISIN